MEDPPALPSATLARCYIAELARTGRRHVVTSTSYSVRLNCVTPQSPVFDRVSLVGYDEIQTEPRVPDDSDMLPIGEVA
jgi:hypothetical protein